MSKQTWWRSAIGAYLMWFFCLVAVAIARPPIDWASLTEEDALPGQLIVGFDQSADIQLLDDLHAQVGAQVMHAYRKISAQVVQLPENVSKQQAASIYMNSPLIEFVEPNYRVYALQTIPNDTLWADLWGMVRINAPEAWDFSTGSSDVVVAVIDTGINYKHLDLVDNMWINPNPDPALNDIHGARWTSGNGSITSGDPMDDQNHGTHCAGTIGAVGNNALGVVGVVWNVRLAGLKFLTASGGGSTADAISAIEYCVERADEIPILSNSWGGGGFSQALFNMIDASRAAGQLFVAAAGNSAQDTDVSPMYPAAYDLPNIISVAAINDSGELAGFSNFGSETVHIGAPGVGIMSTVALGAPENDRYESFQGTSMACPHVAGAAALLLSLSPTATWEELKAAILDGAAPNPALEGRTITGGELDLMGAIALIGGSIQLDRLAYRSDADVTITVMDFAVDVLDPDVPVDVEMLENGGPAERWSTVELLPRVVPGEPTFVTSFTLESQALAVPYSAVEDDVLNVSYLNSLGNVITASAPIDDTPPVITDLALEEVTESTATLVWRTDEPADSRVRIGETLPLTVANEQGSTAFVATPTVRGGVTGYWHEVTFSGLEEESLYFIAVLSADYAGNEASAPPDLTSVDPEDYLRMVSRQRRTVWIEDWEHGTRGYTVTNAQNVTVWQWGEPDFGPATAWSGTKLWGTVLDGLYPAFANASLTSPYFYVGERAQLHVDHWMDVEAIFDRAFIEANRGVGWETLALFDGRVREWTNNVVTFPASFDHKNVRLRFRLTSDDTVEYAGWYIDDLALTELSPVGVYVSSFDVLDDPPGGNGDGFVAPGESFALNLSVFNSDSTLAENVTGQITVSTPGVSLAAGSPQTITFGNVGVGAREFSGSQVYVHVAPWVSVGTRITFMVTLQADNMGPWPAQELHLVVTERETVTGLVVDADSGVPISGALIEGHAMGYPDVSAVSEADGTYRLHGLHVGIEYAVEAVLPGSYSRSDPVMVIGPQSDVDFALGQAFAGPDPADWMVTVDQGATELLVLTLNNANAPYTLDYEFTVDISYLSPQTDWLHVAPMDGSVVSGGTLDLNVEAMPGSLGPGTYSAEIHLVGNDVSDAPVVIPVEMTVEIAPILTFVDWRAIGGDDDGFVEPGEVLDIEIDLENIGSLTALDVEGTLTYTGTEDVLVTSIDASWNDILDNSMATSIVHPVIQLGANVPDGAILTFTLDVIDADARAWSFDFEIPVQIRRTIMGEVTRCDDATPVENAEVRVRDLDGGLLTTTTDALGAYRVDGLTGTNYSVRVIPPSPYASPERQTVSFGTGNETATRDFCVAVWGINVDPGSLTVTVPEGVVSNVPLQVLNTGMTAGSVEFGVRLVSGIVQPAQITPMTRPPVDWDALVPYEDYLPNELLIRFEDHADATVQQAVLTQFGLTSLRTFNRISAIRVGVAANLTLKKVAEELEAHPAVRYVEPNYILDVNRIPNDPLFEDMYSLRNVRQTGGTMGADINVTGVWNEVTGSSNVVVAIIDSGVDYNHPDLAANMVPGYDYGEDDPDPLPGYGAINYFTIMHGTHVAGTVGAVGNNEEGISGVAWEVGLMPLKITTNVLVETPIGEALVAIITLDAVIASVEHCIDNDVPISNNSYGGAFFSGIFYEMLGEAYDAGHLFIAAAGNDSRNNNDNNPRYPVGYNYPNIIGVAASNHDGELAFFSNIGSNTVDIVAPGEDILSTVMLEGSGNPPVNVPSYDEWSGTSMAAPKVAGAAALLKAAVPAATWDMLKRALLDGARRDDGLLGAVASGHLDVGRAYEILQAPWLRVAPNEVDIPANGNTTVDVELNVDTQLVTGTYEAIILVRQGHNYIEVPVTLNVQAAPAPVLIDVEILGGDGDGFAEPGETVDVALTLRNNGSAFLINPVGTLTSSDPNTVIQSGAQAWPDMASGDAATALTAATVHFTGAASGMVPFELNIEDQAGRAWTLSFEVEVEPRWSITGTLTDASTGTGLEGVTVEYWGDAIGQVTSTTHGAYAIHGLGPGTFSVRPLPTTHEVPTGETITLVAGDDTRSFALRATQLTFTNTLTLTGIVNQVVYNDWDLSNAGPADFEFTVYEMPGRRAAVISDGAQLNGVAPVLRKMGFEVNVYSNNYFYSTLLRRASGWYTRSASALAPYDLILADLTGPWSGGRLLSLEERTAIEEYLSRGGQFWFTGPNPISRPDNRTFQALVGADSLDRAVDMSIVTVDGIPLETVFWGYQMDEAIARPMQPLDLATPLEDEDAHILLQAGDAVKAFVNDPDQGGTLVYWGGNRDGTDWTQPGILKDYFRSVLADAFWEPVDWLDVSPAMATAAGDITLSVRADAAGLLPDTYKASVILAGNHPGDRIASAQITFQVEPQLMQVRATQGVLDWMNTPLTGNGGNQSALFQVIHAGPDGVPNTPTRDGQPGGDDQLLMVLPSEQIYGRIGKGYEATPNLGRLQTLVDVPGWVNPGDLIYLRAWDDQSFAGSVAYGDSSLYAIQLSPNESHDFVGWVVDQVLDYPGPNARDTNGDGVPDGWYVKSGMDPRLPVGPLTATATVSGVVGQFGTAIAQFNEPRKLFLSDDFIFVLDMLNRRVTSWNRETLQALFQFGTAGTGNGQFNNPRGMGRHPTQNRFAVADTGNNRIQVFSFNPATSQITFEMAFGSHGTAAGQFRSPSGVAIDALGRILVADTDNHRIQVFNSVGTHLATWGQQGPQDGRFNKPGDVFVDADGLVYVADSGNNRIQGFNGNGTWLWTLGTITSGTTPGRFHNPQQVAVDFMGRLWVTDTSNHRIQVFSPSPQRDFLLAFGSLGSNAGQLRFPYGLTPIDDTGSVLVADTRNHRLQRFDTIIDSDGDGLDDAWEWRNFGHLNYGAFDDPDGDDVPNIGEYRVGSDPNQADSNGNGWSDYWELWYGGDPNDPNSQPHIPFRILEADLDADMVLQWPVEAGATYALESTEDLTSGVWQMVPGSTFTAGANGMHQSTNSLAGSDIIMYRPIRLLP